MTHRPTGRDSGADRLGEVPAGPDGMPNSVGNKAGSAGDRRTAASLGGYVNVGTVNMLL